MVASLERHGYERCYLRVFDKRLSIKDHNFREKEKVFDDKKQAVAEAEKFLARRLKSGSWSLRSKTSEDVYLKHVDALETYATRERNVAGYSRTRCTLLRNHPVSFTGLDKLATAVGVSRESIPEGYQDFLLTIDGFDLSFDVEKKGWGNGFRLCLVSSYSQPWFQEHKSEVPCLRDISEPFVVISYANRVHEELLLTGAVLFLKTGAIQRYEADSHVGVHDTFRDYLEYEMRELGQRFFDARYWVDQKVGSE